MAGPDKPEDLDALIETLRAEGRRLTCRDLEDMILHVVYETPADDPDGPYASRAQAKLNGLDMLRKLMKDSGDEGDDMLDALAEVDDLESPLTLVDDG